jgi:peptidyl-dipeptidase Dcp
MNKKHVLPALVLMAITFGSCQTTKQESDNPLLSSFDTPFEVPPFDLIQNRHFKPAFEEALRQHEEEIRQIVQNTEAPTIANTILALENAGSLLSRVNTIFGNLNSAHTNDSLKALAVEMAPILSAHSDNINLNDTLFQRVKTLWTEGGQLAMTDLERRILDNTYKRFVRSGANLSEEDKEKLRKINSELSVLTVQFGQNLLAETNDFQLIIDKKEDLAGLPQGLVDAAAAEAKAANLEGKWLFTLQNASVMPFLQYADNRELRKQIWEAYKNRGERENDHDNQEVLVKMANLRLEKANLLGYPTHAHYVLEESMAENPENVHKLLSSLWAPALRKAKVEAADIKAEILASGQNFDPQPYDWRYYTEKIRQKRYAIDESEVKPYFSLTSVTQGAFELANKLFGLTFKRLDNVPIYHPEVEVYEVFDKDSTHLGLLYADFFPRATKRGGAWMTSYRPQHYADGKRVAPVISIVCNFTKPVGDQPALLTFDEATTLFHEFGHALHGLMSDVLYKSISGTSVPRDFVELPSQVMENWAGDPEFLKMYAKHYQTGETIPDELVEKLMNVGTFDQGFATVEYLAASLLDMDYHTITAPITEKAGDFEIKSMQKYGLIDEIIPRYRSTYFNHIFASGYSAGYYSYIWAGVLDSDAFAAFKETTLFDQTTADKFRKYILSTGGSQKPAELYRLFRGADPNPVHLMKKRGLQ